MLALELDRLVVIGHAFLSRALAEVRSSDHERLPLRDSAAWRSSHSSTASRTSCAIDQFKRYAVIVARSCRLRGSTIEVTTVSVVLRLMSPFGSSLRRPFPAGAPACGSGAII